MPPSGLLLGSPTPFREDAGRDRCERNTGARRPFPVPHGSPFSVPKAPPRPGTPSACSPRPGWGRGGGRGRVGEVPPRKEEAGRRLLSWGQESSPTWPRSKALGEIPRPPPPAGPPSSPAALSASTPSSPTAAPSPAPTSPRPACPSPVDALPRVPPSPAAKVGAQGSAARPEVWASHCLGSHASPCLSQPTVLSGKEAWTPSTQQGSIKTR